MIAIVMAGGFGTRMRPLTCNVPKPMLPVLGQTLLDRALDKVAATGPHRIVVALHHRERSGRGQVVDSAIYEAVLAMMESLLPEWAVAGYQRERTGAVLPNVSPSNVYPTADGDLVLIAANQDTVFTRLATVMERPGLAADHRFATHSARGAAMAELDDLIAAWTATHGPSEIGRAHV